jgi:pimeloyl-ACP methyl ester carboxylesterase
MRAPGRTRGPAPAQPSHPHPRKPSSVWFLLAVLDAVGLERTVLLGSSEGGAACMYFAAVHPEHVRALVLFAPLVMALKNDECP